MKNLKKLIGYLQPTRYQVKPVLIPPGLAIKSGEELNTLMSERVSVDALADKIREVADLVGTSKNVERADGAALLLLLDDVKQYVKECKAVL